MSKILNLNMFNWYQGIFSLYSWTTQGLSGIKLINVNPIACADKSLGKCKVNDCCKQT